MATPGWYGKLPLLGDFAHRRLPTGFIAACDAWLSQGISASRDTLGEAWLDSYLRAPLWCFAWAPRAVDNQWWSGVLMPSVDAVGRYFPLMIAFNHAQAPTDAAGKAQWAMWYDRAAACALQTLQDGANLDRFESALSAAGTPLEMPPADGAPGQGRQGAVDTAMQALGMNPPGRTAWWPQAEGESPGAVTLFQGLPTADRFVALLQGALQDP